jgi:hypothetical protein
VVVDLEGRIVEPTPYAVNPAGFVIHSAIHAARPDAHSVLHPREAFVRMFYLNRACDIQARAGGRRSAW